MRARACLNLCDPRRLPPPLCSIVCFLADAFCYAVSVIDSIAPCEAWEIMNSDESRWALVKPRAIIIDGDRVAYRVAGRGPVLLLVHGMAGSSVTWRHANTLRDLLNALGYKRATVIGQSLGGGVAMQFAYQFPEPCDRLVLVDSGGLGREVTFYLRMLTAPGFESVFPLLCTSRLRDAGNLVATTSSPQPSPPALSAR
jgi:alpha/beta hydrolase fold